MVRRNTVMYQMRKYDFLTNEIYDSLKVLPITLRYHAEDISEGSAPYFREYLRTYLVKWFREHRKPDGSKYSIYKDGLRIYTTIDSRMQRYAEQAVQEQMTDLQKTFFTHWKGASPFKDVPEIITRGMKRTARYAGLKAQGFTEEQITANFNKKVPMTIFS